MKCSLTLLLLFSFSQFLLFSQGPWTRCSNGLPSNQVLSMTRSGLYLFAGTDKGGVFRSADGGANWTSTPTHTSLTQQQAWSMASIDTFIFAGLRGGGVLRSSVNGSSWTVCNNGITKKIIQDLMVVNNKIYAASYGGGVYVSSDMGSSWTVLYNNAGLDDVKEYALASNSNMLFLGTAGVNTTMPDTGVAFRTPHNGQVWELINNGFIRNGAHLESVFSMDANDNLVFAGTDDVGIFRSTDQGTTWNPVGSYNGDIHAIKIAGTSVYYGTSYGGVYTSADQGLTWSANNSGLSFGGTTIPFLVKDFLVSGNTIYAATDIGVFRQTLPAGSVGLNKVAGEEQPAFSPNPFTEGTIVHLKGVTAPFVVSDALGRIVFSGTVPGQGTLVISKDQLGKPGVYFVTVMSPAKEERYRIMLSE
jgi:photosystem II stability/assembly factor-like uncharacterized protein